MSKCPSLVDIVLFLKKVRLLTLKVVNRCLNVIFSRAGGEPICCVGRCDAGVRRAGWSSFQLLGARVVVCVFGGRVINDGLFTGAGL